ncbi:N-dimethylarginine dimethylaminohydrolase [Pontibacter ummariensis]|uniref:arginine deiminase n=1 Tax=Pontibacter ummariensis TaxID=1610492 RepID=A0A239EA59_9BACT|nr:arginine deiminase family protein [Pontibacter ummariensis]PRY13160.1 N-dimethylarginine dimethylaminohydrolase [Pontibacter ummariensis]SNS41585.1 N-Dimethylarginine dimethylaminohydrolase [Pontibacter ummariensis]
MIQQHSETDTLQKVIIGRYENYNESPAYAELVNEEQKTGLPPREQLKEEFENFRNVLTEAGVEVLVPDYVGKFVYDQLTPRDIGVVIGEKFLLCNMVKRSRRYESAGIFRYLHHIPDSEPNIIIPDSPTCFIEGGDILIDKGNIFVAVSQRTNQEGVEFLKEQFGDVFNIVPIKARALAEGENVLHLDCMFNPVGEKAALIYEEGFEAVPREITDVYELIKVDKAQQQELATNILSLSQDKVISRDHPLCKPINDMIRKTGVEVVEIKFDAAPATGGSFRCCTLPLLRGQY